MKRENLQQRKEAIVVYEEGISEIKAISNLSIPHSSKIILFHKLYTFLEKIGMYCTNCHRKNHNVETYKIKRKEDPIVAIFEVIIQQIIVERHVQYSYHICGDTGHKIINCPKYNDM
jgi:hypothetical protein